MTLAQQPELRRIFRGVEFSHAFQPIISCRSRSIYGYEALLRGPNGEPPWYVFERVEGRDQVEFERRLNQSASSFSRQRDMSGYLFLNVTSQYLLDDQGDYLISLTRPSPNSIDPTQVVLEISESSSSNARDLTMILNKLRSAGFNIALDDFGAGYAGMNVLVDVNPDLIKLDMHLIRNINESGVRQAMLDSILTFCEAMGVLILAEGVETEQEFRFLRNRGIDLFQGFLFARPGLRTFANVYNHPTL